MYYPKTKCNPCFPFYSLSLTKWFPFTVQSFIANWRLVCVCVYRFCLVNFIKNTNIGGIPMSQRFLVEYYYYSYDRSQKNRSWGCCTWNELTDVMGCSIPLPATAEANDSIRGECAMSCLFFYFLSGDFPLGEKKNRRRRSRKKKQERVPRHFLRVKGVREKEEEKMIYFAPCLGLFSSTVHFFVRVLYRSDYETTGHGRNSNADAIVLHL